MDALCFAHIWKMQKRTETTCFLSHNYRYIHSKPTWNRVIVLVSESYGHFWSKWYTVYGGCETKGYLRVLIGFVVLRRYESACSQLHDLCVCVCVVRMQIEEDVQLHLVSVQIDQFKEFPIQSARPHARPWNAIKTHFSSSYCIVIRTIFSIFSDESIMSPDSWCSHYLDNLKLCFRSKQIEIPMHPFTASTRHHLGKDSISAEQRRCRRAHNLCNEILFFLFFFRLALHAKTLRGDAGHWFIIIYQNLTDTFFFFFSISYFNLCHRNFSLLHWSAHVTALARWTHVTLKNGNYSKNNFAIGWSNVTKRLVGRISL